MKNPRVSVIIPTFNRPLLTCEAAGSVLTQSFQDFELIIADDGSSDTTQKDVERFIETFPVHQQSRVKFLSLEHCGFPGAVRNRAVECSRGDYVAFLDSDDLWMKEKLEEQIHFFDTQNEIRIQHTREKWLRGSREISQSKLRHKRQGDIFQDALRKCIIGPSTVILTRRLYDFYGGFREDLEIAEDYEFWLRITANEKVGYIDIPLITKRAGHGEQLSEKYGQIEIFRIQALRDLVAQGFFQGEKDFMAREELQRKVQIYSAGCRKRGRFKEAEELENSLLM